MENANRFRRRNEGEAPVLASPSPATGAVDGIANLEGEAVAATSSASPLPGSTTAQRSRSVSARRAAAASMQFDEDDASDEEPPLASGSSKRVSSSMKADEAESSTKRVKLGDGSATPAPASSNGTARSGASYKFTQSGKIDFCAMCASKFTITTYT